MADSLFEANASHVALVTFPTSAADDDLAAKASSAGSLLISVECVGNHTGPWRADNLPGAAGGCGHWAGQEPRHIRMRSDRDGLYFLAVADLLLRSNNVRDLAIVGSIPEAFARNMTLFAAQNGYGILEGGAAGPKSSGDSDADQPLSSLEERVRPGNAALVLIDVQNDFCAPDGATGRTAASMSMINAAVARIKALLAAAREAGLFIVHVRAEYGELFRNVGSPYRFLLTGGREPAVWTASAADLSNGARIPNGVREVCLPESWGGEFVAGIDPRPGEAIVTKHRFSAFVDTGLNSLLRANSIRTVILAGVTTNCCVESTARDAAMFDYYVAIASDCVGVKDHLRDLHDASLESLGLYFGLVRPSAQIIASWTKLPRAAREA